jgi:drug/metabolite transporter (DMT)-like permease
MAPSIDETMEGYRAATAIPVVVTSESPAPSARRVWLGEHQRGLGVALWVFLSLIWGSTWLFIKLGLRDLPPISFAGIRFVIAAMILLVVVAVRRPQLPSGLREWGFIAATGFLAFTMNYGLLFWGEQRTSSGLAAILQTIIPVVGMLIAHYYLPDERITPGKLVGVVLAMAGVAIIFSNQAGGRESSSLLGSAAIVIGACSVAYANVLVKAHGRHFEPSVIASGQMVFGLIPLLLVGFTLEGNPFRFHWTWLALTSLLYLALIGSAVAFLIYYWLVRHMDVTRTMLIPLVTPLIAVSLGMFVLNEEFSWRTAVGGVCIMSGIGMIVLRRIKR